MRRIKKSANTCGLCIHAFGFGMISMTPFVMLTDRAVCIVFASTDGAKSVPRIVFSYMMGVPYVGQGGVWRETVVYMLRI